MCSRETVMSPGRFSTGCLTQSLAPAGWKVRFCAVPHLCSNTLENHQAGPFSLRRFQFYIKSFQRTPIKDTQLGLIRTKTVWQAFCRFITAFYSLHVWCTLSEVRWAHFETSCDQLAKSKQELWQYRKTSKMMNSADTRFNHILFVDCRTHLKDVKTLLTFYAFTFTTLMTKSQTVGQILVFKRASQLFLAHLLNFFVSEHQYSGAARHGLLLRCLRAKCCKFRVLFPSSWLK